MEIFDRLIKCVDEFKVQIVIPLRHITLNLPDNVVVARNRLEQQRRQSLTRKSERIVKYHEKITRLKIQGYVEKVDHEEPTTSG